MPELPEVEVIRRELEPLLKGKVFAEPVLPVPSTIGHPDPELFSTSLPGREIKKIKRTGKYLVINLDRGILTVHLRMTSNLLYVENSAAYEERFLRVSLPFTDGSALHYSDMRRFGRLWLTETQEELKEIVLKQIGPDILNDLCLADFLELLGKRERSRIKALLLDQGFAAGLGNIYTDECLYRSGIDPNRRVQDLKEKEAEKLYQSILEVLDEGIKYGGTTFRDYRNARGALGDFQNRLAVYGRKDELCRCGAFITKTKVAGRGTYYCPHCQK